MSSAATGTTAAAQRGAGTTAAGPARHVDVAVANWPPVGAGVSPYPPSSRGLTPRQHAPVSMVAVIQEQWLLLCEYFQRVQCANTHDERGSLVKELGAIEHALTAILDALLTDRKLLVNSFLALQNRGTVLNGSLFSESLATSHPAAAAVTPPTRAATTPSPSLSSSCLLNGLDRDCAALPPCYRLLFADVRSRSVTPTEDDGSGTPDRDGTAAAAVAPPAPAAAAAAGHSEDPPPIGSIFLLTLCQYAKQDEPPGVRSVILGFLSRLLQEADLPTDRAAYPAGDPAMSLLQLNPPVLVVPVLDMVRKVGRALDPANAAAAAAAAAASAGSSTTAPTLTWVVDDPLAGTFLQDAGRTQFVIFLTTLAEKMERVPALANFFVVEDGTQERDLFVLLDALLLYLTHDCSTPEWTHRRDTCRFALSAVVSLAKCPDPWIQDLVAKEARVATRTLSAARTTLLTLCKIPDNDDGVTQLLYLRDVVRFWATLTAMAPSVADALQLPALIEKEFVRQTLLPLLQSADSHVYAAACVVAARLLSELQGTASVLTDCFAHAILSTTIRKASGRVVPGKRFYDVVVLESAAGTAPTRGQQEEKAAAALQEHPMTSFFAYYVLPHLSSNPCLSDEDNESCAVLGFATTRWSAAKATLLLTQTLAETVPHLFLREVFLMDVTSLSDVHRKQHASAAAAPASAAAEGGHRGNAEVWGTAGAPPHMSIHGCFLNNLQVAAGSQPAMGLQPDRVGEAVLTRLLRVEGNMPAAALRARQRVMSVMTQPNTAPASAAGARAKSPSPPASEADSSNSWFHVGVQTSPLTRALCGLVRHLDSAPYTVSSLVADLVVSIAVLPDLRVLYTLLDPQRGPLVMALCGLRDLLRHHMEGKAAVSSPTKKGKGNASSAAAAAAAAKSAMSVSLPFLYDMLLQHWDLLVLDADADADKSPASPEQSGRGSEASVESIRDAVKANSNVLYACLYAEYLHAYLDAVIGYTALSQNLMYLKVSS